MRSEHAVCLVAGEEVGIGAGCRVGSQRVAQIPGPSGLLRAVLGPLRTRLERFLLDLNRNSYRGFP